MSIFLAPMQKKTAPEMAKRYQTSFGLHFIRGLALFVSLSGALAALLQTFILGFLDDNPLTKSLIDATMGLLNQAALPLWLGFCLGGLILYLIVSMISNGIAAAGGRTLLESIRDDPSERMLIGLMQQTNNSYLLKNPVFKIGGETLSFDLAVVSTQGVTLISACRPAKAYPDLAEFKSSLARLSEQYSLPLLTRIRFLQLWEPKIGPEWQICTPRDLSRFFQRNDVGAGKQEISASLRAIYNLMLPPHLPAVPVQGSLPATGELHRTKQYRAPSQHKTLKIGAIGLLFGLIILVVLGTGLYFLQFVNYEAYERLVLPVREVLRDTLPLHWQEQIGLGQDKIVGETAVLATTTVAVRLSNAVGRTGDADTLAKGAAVQIIQIQNHQGVDWYLVRQITKTNHSAEGWLPGTSVLPRHLVKRGTPIYSRPASDIQPDRFMERDEPVALLMIQTQPSPSGDKTWSKVAFLGQSTLDKATAYIQGNL